MIGAGGGCSAVHEHSALEIDDKLYLAVGDSVVCLSLESPRRLLWSVQTDMATCFGIHWAEQQRALISHGELEISRLSTEGVIAWQTSGADIFSEGFRLLSDYVETIDFNGAVYRIDYVTEAFPRFLGSQENNAAYRPLADRRHRYLNRRQSVTSNLFRVQFAQPMYSVDLEILMLDFDTAMIKVPRDGNYDWMNEDWIETRQRIEIFQGERSATVLSSTGQFSPKGSHSIEILSPQMYTTEEVIAHLLAKPNPSGLPEGVIRKSVEIDHHSWGNLISLNWGALGYAPGGTEYCLLPDGSPAISIGFLRLDWKSVRICPKHRST